MLAHPTLAVWFALDRACGLILESESWLLAGLKKFE